jgi:tetratricopeptide (TPR) repeat protein
MKMDLPTSPLGQTTKANKRQKADALRKAGKHDEAVLEYAAIWPDGDPWTGWGYAYCLRKLKRVSEALAISQAVYGLDPEFKLGRSMLAWCLYDSIHDLTEPTDQLRSAARKIIELTEKEENKYDSRSPFAISVLRVVRVLCRAGRHSQALRWLEKLEPTHLDTAEFAFKDESGRLRKFASKREAYYALRTHSLERLKRWDECLEVATVASTACQPLHHDNDVWFARRIALAKWRLGRLKEAVPELEALLARKETSFLHTDIAGAALELADFDKTFTHALAALLSAGELKFKLTALSVMARVLWAKGRQTEAVKHLELDFGVRAQLQWKPNPVNIDLAAQWGADVTFAEPDERLSELKMLWAEWDQRDNPRYAGQIERLLPNGRSGFLRGSNQERFYFELREWRDRNRKPAPGARVTFKTQPSFDKKHQRASVIARDIKLAPS